MNLTTDLPPNVYDKCSNLLINNYNNNCDSFGIVVQSLNMGEFAVHLIDTINSFVASNPYIDVCLFSLNKTLPIIIPNCAIFSNADLNNYQYNIIVTDIPTWQACDKSPAKNKFFYFYDIHILPKVPKELIKKINESNYYIFSRTAAHNKQLEKAGFKVCNQFCEKISTDDILKTVKEILNANDRTK